jgi:hypothetical protein
VVEHTETLATGTMRTSWVPSSATAGGEPGPRLRTPSSPRRKHL